MIRMQVRLTEEQSEALKRLAAQEGNSVAALIRLAVNQLIRSQGAVDRQELRRRAIAVAGKFHSGDENLSADHDRHATRST